MNEQQLLHLIMSNFKFYDKNTIIIISLIIASFIVYKTITKLFEKNVDMTNSLKFFYNVYFIISLILVFFTTTTYLLYFFLLYTIWVFSYFIFSITKNRKTEDYLKLDKNKQKWNKNILWLMKEEVFFITLLLFFILSTIWIIISFKYF